MTQPETGLRSRIAAAAAGELRRVKARVDWDGEIGAVTRANIALAGPALLFENIRGHGDTLCTRLMTCGLSTRKRVAMMADLPSDASDKDLVRHFRNRYRSPTAPVVVGDGPVKAHTLRDNQIDLGQFPSPRWHGSDGGCYYVLRRRHSRPLALVERRQPVGKPLRTASGPARDLAVRRNMLPGSQQGRRDPGPLKHPERTRSPGQGC